MKRILAITLTLIMLLAALTGCMASKNPSGSEGKQDPSGKSLPITLTIAETEPSCPAFESDCFYAFDAEGILYRVLWTDFTNLNEKDTVVVEYSKKEELNIPTDLTGGFHAKYEITANSVNKEINPEDYLVSHIQIKSGDNTIYPFGSLLWSKTDNGDGTFTELNASMLDTVEIINLYTNIIPKLVLDESVSYLVQANGSVENVYLFTQNGETYTKSETTFDALSNLADGTYYVALNVLLGGNCDPDAPQNSYRYEDVFCLLVGEHKNTDILTNSAVKRVWDRHHPDDSERSPYFSIFVPELNDTLITFRENFKIYMDNEYLLGGPGYGCESFYLSDLTGDGKPELCFGMNFGSGLIDLRIQIFDYETRECIYTLSDRGFHDYYIFVRNGDLCIKETEYMKQDAVRTGVLSYDGAEINVSWDTEIDVTVDRDKRNSITMTIAETLPSCAAFEYQPGAPYCFYAFDSDGKLYRVLWTDWNNLNENDKIVVEYSDIKMLTYPEPTSGPNPQYEITALCVRVEETAIKLPNLSESITFSSGDVLSQKALSDDDKQIILNILGSDKEWISDIPECDWICRFSGSVSVGYCDCGTISDFTNNRSCKLTDEEKESIESLIWSYTDYFTHFSFTDEKAMFPPHSPGVKISGFKNTTESPINTYTDAIERAKNECTIERNDTQVYYDADTGVWKVLFYTKDVPGSDQSVYLGTNGTTFMIVYGE